MVVNRRKSLTLINNQSTEINGVNDSITSSENTHKQNNLNISEAKDDNSMEESIGSNIDFSMNIDNFLENAYYDSYSEDPSWSFNIMNLARRWKFWMMFSILGIANIGDVSEYASIGYLLADKSFQNEILNDNTKSDGLLASVALMGLIFGGLLTGVYEDSLGRKRALLLGLGFNFLGGVLSIFAVNVITIAMFRFIAGLGIGAIISSLSALSSELSPPTKRGLFVGFVGSFGEIGKIGISLLAMLFFGKLDLSWRYFVAACAVPAALCFILVLIFVPESPRFLLLHGKFLEGLTNANHIARNKLSYTGPLLTLEDIKEQQFMPNSVLQYHQPKTIHDATKEAFANIVALYSNPNIRKNVIAVMILWSCISAGSIGIYITTIYEEIGITDIYKSSLYSSIASIPGHVTSTLLVDRVGRKRVFSISMFLSAFTLVYFSWISASDISPQASKVIIASCAHAVCNTAAWVSLHVMIGEVFPTKVRSTAIGVCATAGRLSNIAVQLVYGHLIETPQVLLLVASAFMIFGAIATACTAVDEMAQVPLLDIPTESHNHRPIVKNISHVRKGQSEEAEQRTHKTWTLLSVNDENDKEITNSFTQNELDLVIKGKKMLPLEVSNDNIC